MQCCNGYPEGECPVQWDCPSAPTEAPKMLPWGERYEPGTGPSIGMERRQMFENDEVNRIHFLAVLYDKNRIGGESDGETERA